MKILITGRGTSGSWKIRGEQLGQAIGATVAEQRVHVHDFHATILHLLGLDHERLTYQYQGRHYRLTDVAGAMVPGIIA